MPSNTHSVKVKKDGSKIITKSSLYPSSVPNEQYPFLYSENTQFNHHETDPGKWLIYVSRELADKVWDIIKTAMEEGIFSFMAKISTVNEHKTHVLCVYTPYTADLAEIRNTYLKLVELGIVTAIEPIKYKSDNQTIAGEYGPNAYLYSSTIMNNDDHFNCVSSLLNYIAQRETERDYFFLTGFFKGMSKAVKISAAAKLVEVLNDKSNIIFTPKELQALKDCRLGKIISLYQHLIPANLWAAEPGLVIPSPD